MKTHELRAALEPPLRALGAFTHRELDAIFKELGLREPPLSEDEEGRSKSRRVEAVLEALPDSDLARVAELIVARYPPSDRPQIIALEDALWSAWPHKISKRSRRGIADKLEAVDLFQLWKGFIELLDRLVELDDDPYGIFGPSHRSLKAQIEQHVLRNPGDWTVYELLERLGAFEFSDRRFCILLEGLVSCEVQRDEASQIAVVEAINAGLDGAAVRLKHVEDNEGYPVFRIAPLNSHRGGAKNIIFASPIKPDLRFSDAINNDIEIVSHADQVLVFDEPIGDQGITWRRLQDWWRRTQSISDEDAAKQTLYRRLFSSLPSSSPPQRNLFKAYHETFGALIPELPALLPEVWLYWDPKTVRQRGADALTRFRMDFLLLLPSGVRVVVEVDGVQHYSDDERMASPSLYARMVASDRDLRLSGYEVYRFGGQELHDYNAAVVVTRSFFSQLYANYSLKH